MALDTDQRWRLSPLVFEKLLDQLGPDREAAAREYETIRRKLLDFFDRRRACSPEALADETLDRVARRLYEGEAVQQLRAYCYGIARRVLLESEKRQARERAASDELRLLARGGGALNDADSDPGEARAACLKRCLQELPGEGRELIVAYYRGRGVSHLAERKELALRLGLTYVTLKTRAHRLRNQLRHCLHTCLEAKSETNDRPAPHQSERVGGR